MKSAVFYAKHDIKVEEISMPIVGENDVLIKVMACGICGTDVHIYEGDEGAAESPPKTVLGHEFSGVVESVGANVKNVKAGDRVCIDPNELCGECYYCKSAIGHFCESMKGYGTTSNGGFSEYCVADKKQVYKIGDNTSFEEGAMAEPVACCLHGIDMCNITAGDVVCVIGGGMIGLIMLQLAAINGAHEIIMLEPVKEKREIAKKLGATICIDPLNEDVKSVLKEKNIHRINCVIECVGLKSTMSQAIDLAGKKSIVMMFGLTKPDDTIDIKPFEIFKKEVEIKASFINPYTQTRALDLINSKKVDVKSMIHDVRPLEDLTNILSDGKLRSKGKFIINPWL